MKKIILSLGLLIPYLSNFAQNGLENIIVEKYYVSNLNDASVNSVGGVLPVGSVTYRIYVDMLPGYRFQAAFGIPGHELRLETTTLFFNNEDRGATSPTYSKAQAANNTVMLDSWLSVGAACNGQFGVLKSEDDGIGTVVNADGVLQNNDTSAGIPLTMQDGMIPGTAESVTAVGISTEMAIFDNQNDGTNGPLFSTSNGSWAALNGAVGPDSASNKVLIAQITTDGTFSFELNIQIGTPTGGVEQYVARNPVNDEILFPALIYSSPTTLISETASIDPLFTVYPNPTKDNLSLEIMSENSAVDNFYRIYDTEGRIVISKHLGTIYDYYSDKIDVSTLSNGQYTIELSMDGNTAAKKFIKN